MYLNFPGFFEEGDSLMYDAFGANYERLVEIKNEYARPTSSASIRI